MKERTLYHSRIPALVEDLNTLPLRARLAKQLTHLVRRSYGVPSLSRREVRIGLQWRRKNSPSCWALRARASTTN